MIMPRLAEIRKELSAARACTDSIFSLFQPETLYERPIPERHRVIFYLGHLEAFDWNQICRWTLGQSLPFTTRLIHCSRPASIPR